VNYPAFVQSASLKLTACSVASLCRGIEMRSDLIVFLPPVIYSAVAASTCLAQERCRGIALPSM